MGKKLHFIVNKSEATAGTRGASLGPEAIFTAARKKGDLFFGDFEREFLPDYNLILDQAIMHPFAKRIETLEKVVDDVIHSTVLATERGFFPILISGDHGSAAGTLMAMLKCYANQKIGVVWIDAHGDLHTPYTTPSGNMHGMPLAIGMSLDNLECKRNEIPEKTKVIWERLKDKNKSEETIRPENVLFIGVRDTEKEEDFLIEKYAIKNITVEELRTSRREVLRKQLDAYMATVDVLYVSFDVDSMDPDLTSYGTGTPVPNGLTVEEAQDLLLYFAEQPKLKCLEFVEVNPCLDEKTNTMAEITFELIKNTANAIKGMD